MTPDPKTNIAEPKPHLFDLWKFFSDEHKLTLVESELDDIIRAVVKHAPEEVRQLTAVPQTNIAEAIEAHRAQCQQSQ